MASQTNSSISENPTPPSPSGSLRRWWSRPIVTIPAGREATFKEFVAMVAPFCVGLLTVLTPFLILLFIDKAHTHAKFSIRSIAVSPSAATCHVDFLVENPSSRYSIHYEADGASVTLGHVNVAVFNVTRKPSHGDHTTAAFSLDFVAEEVNRTDVVPQELHIKLKGKHKLYLDYGEAGHFDVRCQILTPSHENVDKIKCHSSFTHLEMLV